MAKKVARLKVWFDEEGDFLEDHLCEAEGIIPIHRSGHFRTCRRKR